VRDLGLAFPPADECRHRTAALAVSLHRLPNLGFTNVTAFSPTDAMPLKPWVELTMECKL
jgi:hypothetical protein